MSLIALTSNLSLGSLSLAAGEGQVTPKDQIITSVEMVIDSVENSTATLPYLLGTMEMENQQQS